MVDFNSMNGMEVLIYLLTSPEERFLWVLIGLGLAIWLLSLYMDRDNKQVDCKPTPPEHHL
tara:strand:+ start:210 stop:392 length:183 start_codon:yes stop_codon:yes gene_type:complete